MLNRTVVGIGAIIAIAIGITLLATVFERIDLDDYITQLAGGLTLIGLGIVYWTFRPQIDRRMDSKVTKEKEKEHSLKQHCNYLAEKLNGIVLSIDAESTIQDSIKMSRHVGYWNQVREHLFTEYPEIYEAFERVIKSNKTAVQLKLENNHDYNKLWEKSTELLRNIRGSTTTFGGACNGCLKYHNKKDAKRFKERLFLLPPSFSLKYL